MERTEVQVRALKRGSANLQATPRLRAATVGSLEAGVDAAEMFLREGGGQLAPPTTSHAPLARAADPCIVWQV
jgi:hypothetical protein